MEETKMGGAAYMNAYLNGMQFILLALEGRLEQLQTPSKEHITEVLYEYHELAMRMRERAQLGVSP